MNKDDIEKAVAELKAVLKTRFGNEMELYLFGSVARDEYSFDSDIDILLLLPVEVDTSLKTEIIDLAFYVGLKNDVIFNIITQSKNFWESEMAAVTPFHQNLEREALRL